MRMPEAADGSGADLLEAALVCEEAGRRIAPIPLADAMAAGPLLAAVGAGEILAADRPLQLAACFAAPDCRSI